MRHTLRLEKLKAVVHVDSATEDGHRITAIAKSTPDVQVVRASGDLAQDELLAPTELHALRTLDLQSRHVGRSSGFMPVPRGCVGGEWTEADRRNVQRGTRS
jgi:hypothetical protein